MALLEIRTWPSEVLKKKAAPVDAVDEEIRTLMDDMLQTMYAGKGIGLAAPQVGVSKRVIVLHIVFEGDEDLFPVIMLANPEIVAREGEVEFEEGCLSLPGLTVKVKRSEAITVRGLDHDNNEVSIEAEGLLAIALQHEMDHLDGTLILDHASSIKREFYKKRIRKSLARA